MQTGALAWGVQALYSQRPVLMAFVGFNQNRFFPVTEDLGETGTLLSSRITSVLRQSERFSAIDAEWLARIVRTSRTRKTYEVVTPQFAEGIDRFLAANSDHADKFAFIPLYGRFGYGLLAISKADGHIAGVVAKEISLR